MLGWRLGLGLGLGLGWRLGVRAFTLKAAARPSILVLALSNHSSTALSSSQSASHLGEGVQGLGLECRVR